MSARWRLAALGTVLAAGTVLLFALLLVALATAAGPQDQDDALDALATAAAAGFEPGGSASPAIVTDLGTSLDPAVVVTDRTGEVVYSQARIGGRPPRVPLSLVEDALARQVSKATVSLAGVEVRMVGRARPDGVAVAVQQTAYVAGQRRGLWGVVLLAAVFTALAGAVASWVVSGRALRPLRDLATTVGEVARTGDLGRRLDVPRRSDEVGRLAREFNAMMDRIADGRARLAAALEEQKRFVADASHELRTPLTTIRSNAGFLAERPDAEPSDRAEAVADVRAEADRMSRLVDDLLVLARTDAVPEPARRPVDLGTLAADVARVAGAACEVRVPPGAPAVVVLGDADLLRRAVGCVVDNAVLHGGGAPVLVTVARPDGPGGPGHWAVVTVRDHGPGFPPDAVGRVFERFYRADPARSGRGSGLGLSITSAVAGLHGGGVAAQNAPDGGAVVTLHLPAA
ncbi:cell wall metabolism sensor histidine kinase WalK [Kineosporia sp. A_224]|uniref:sensor histidine kinase n=1 Tax=Kineosporia sp. A_224 TaxID=1962180 RepID=UPI000B4AB77C|nr:HAMP domain-containing sensor histidine kinase [Kineosporia sp. A_224]